MKEELLGFSELGFEYIAWEVFGDTQAEMCQIKEQVGQEDLGKARWLERVDLGVLISGRRTKCWRDQSRRALGVGREKGIHSGICWDLSRAEKIQEMMPGFQ